MSNDNTRDAAEPSLASDGSYAEPFAWAAECAPGAWSFTHMRHVASRWPQSETIPLYRKPQPTLTDEEREAIMRLCEAVAEYSEIDRQENGCHADDDMAAVAVARGLLKRMV